MTIEQNKNSVAACPFCGGFAMPDSVTECIGHGEYIKLFYVRCVSCGARGSVFDDYDGATHALCEFRAVDAWNNRFDQSCKNRGGSR